MLWVASGFGEISAPLELHVKVEGRAAADLAERTAVRWAVVDPLAAVGVPPSAVSAAL